MTALIVDDEKVICDGLRTLVERLALPELTTVRTAYRADDALQIVREIVPDILVTDIRMPGKTGLELIADARRVRPDLRAIIVTGYDDFELVREALRLEAIDYLLKPATRNEVRAALERAIDEIRRIEETRTALDNERQSFFDSLIDTAWPWFAEGVHLTPAAIRRLDDGLRERIGFNTTMLVAFESETEDPSVVGRELLTGVAPAGGEELVWRLREEGAASIGILAAATSGALTETARALARAAQHGERLHVSYAGPRTGVGSLPAMMAALRLARVRKLVDDGYVHEYLETGQLADSDTWARAKARDLADALRRTPEAERSRLRWAADAVRDAAGDPNRLLAFWTALEETLRRETPPGTLGLPAIAGFFTADGAARAIVAAVDRTSDDAAVTQHRAVVRARAFVAEHYHEQHTMQDVADRLGMSYAYFSTLFKQQTGDTYSHYLTRVRMEEAARLFDESDMPVAEVAARVGYLYPKHFTRAFKRFHGRTPQQYVAGQAAQSQPDDGPPTP